MNGSDLFAFNQKLYQLLDEYESAACAYERNRGVSTRGKMVAARLAICALVESVTEPPCTHGDVRRLCALCQEGPMNLDPPAPMGDGEDVWFWRNKAT